MVRHLLSLFFFVFISVAYIHAQCNGGSAICNKQYDHVVYVTTHNAFNYSGPFQAPNQTYSVSQQLQDGVRAFMLDVHDYFGVPTLYHGVFALGTEPLEDVLIDIRDFMDQNQNEIVTLIFECYVSADEMDTVFTAAGLKPYLHEQSLSTTWPTLQEMINSDKRLVVLTDVDDAGAGQEWYHYMWDYCVETHYTANSRADFSCDFNRGDSINSLFILNNFITSILGTGLIDSAIAINSNPYLIDRANHCMSEKGKLPNFLTVDFYEVGNVFEAKDILNDNFTPLIGLPEIDCSKLELTGVNIDLNAGTIDVIIYNGDTNDIHYPYVSAIVNAVGDTIQYGSANLFLQFALGSSTYSYTLNSNNATYPLTVFFAYSNLTGGMGADTCILTTGLPLGVEQTNNLSKKLLFVTDLVGRITQPANNRLLIYKYSDGTVEKKTHFIK